MNKSQESRIKIILSFSMLIAIASYHFLLKFFSEDYPGLDVFFTVFSFIISSVIIFISTKNKILIKLIENDNYIAGKYSGKSTIGVTESDETVIIKQSLLLTSIKGETQTNEFKSIWEGRLIKSDNSTFTFYIDLVSQEGSVKGICILSKNENDLNGFYLSTTDTSKKAIITLTKKTKKWNYFSKKDQ